MSELVVVPVAPSTFRKNGFSYNLVKSQEGFAIYSQSKKGRLYGYEVIKLRVWAGCKGRYAKLEGAARLPSNEEFGSFGWSYETLPAALAKFESLQSRAGLKTAEAGVA